MRSQIQITDYEELNIMNPQRQKPKSNPNRLYLCWINSKGYECKMIGPETKCFCNHRFKQHESHNPVNKKTPCKAAKCACNTFQYIPTHGSYDFKCLICKHSFKEHNRKTKKCQRQKCQTKCSGFTSSWTCSCGEKYDQHRTLEETLQQRRQKGKVVNDMERMAGELYGAIQKGSLYDEYNNQNMENVMKTGESSKVQAKIEIKSSKEVRSRLSLNSISQSSYSNSNSKIEDEIEELILFKK